MKDLLNEDRNDPPDKNGTILVEQTENWNETDGSVPVGETTDGVVSSGELTQEEQEEELQAGAPSTLPSAVDVFGLDYGKFMEEQERVPWMRAMKAFLKDGAVALDPQLSVTVLKMSPHHLMKNEVLMRRVHLGLYGRDPVLPIDLAFLNTGKDWKSNEVAAYRRKLYLSLRDSRRLVERQLLKAQDRHEQRLGKQVKVTYEVGDPVWVYQYFRAKVGENKTKKLAFSWHGQVGENAYKIAIPRHPAKVVTVNVNRLKRFRGRWSQPFADDIPQGSTESVTTENVTDENVTTENVTDENVTTENVTGSDMREETAFAGVSSPIVFILAKKMEKGELQYLVLTATYETFWLSRAALAPEFGTLITAFEDADRKKKGLPELRRSARLVEANADVEDADVLF
ncbi:hypothetical protein PInf_014826 [Phytophthora infestans]|nr:hypothetical protein PInf_014826 [Phytophthora infestans]